MTYEIENGVLTDFRFDFEEERTITEVIVPETIKSVGNCAFYDYHCIQKVKLPQSLESIGEDSFFFCLRLSKISIPDSVVSIGKSAFGGCENLLVMMTDSVKKIHKTAFEDCVLIFLCRNEVSIPFIYTKNRQQFFRFIGMEEKEREQFFCEKLSRFYKIPLALFMALAYQQKNTVYFSYLKEHIEEAVVFLIDTEDVGNLSRLFDFGLITTENINKFIKYAVKHIQRGGSTKLLNIFLMYKDTL